MSEITNFLSVSYATLIKNIENIHLENFSNTSSDRERLEFLYPLLKDEFKTGIREYGKSFEVAVESKKIGISHFAKKEYNKALKSFSDGIITCPEDNDEQLKIKCLLIGNRSATLYELEEYEKAFRDIDYSLELNVYPKDVKYKLFLRKLKCLKYIRTQQKNTDVDEIYKLGVECLKYSNLNEKAFEEKRQDFNELKTELRSFYMVNLLPVSTTNYLFTSNEQFKNASVMIEFAYEKQLGRFAKAKVTIEPGTVLINEPAHCTSLENQYYLTHCQHCMLETDTPVSCSRCANVVYCSVECSKAASIYHNNECGLHPAFILSKISINCKMALRIITQHPLEYFKTENFEINSHENTQHYRAVYSLCRNEHLRKPLDYLHYTAMTIFLLRLLKMSPYMEKSEVDYLTDDEILLGTLILRNLQILQFNGHEISELQNTSINSTGNEEEENFKSSYIGAGLYPTLALFNHSCDPSIVRFNVGSRVIVKAIRPIKSGEVIYENYGPIYSREVKDERKRYLIDRYWFDCECEACVGNWPLFKHMSDDMVKIACKKCNGFALLHPNLEDMAFYCVKCKSPINMLSALKALSELENILAAAETLYKNKDYDKAQRSYLKAINLYFKHTVRPFPDWIKVQQCLRTCFTMEGNKSIKFNKLFKAI